VLYERAESLTADYENKKDYETKYFISIKDIIIEKIIQKYFRILSFI